MTGDRKAKIEETEDKMMSNIINQMKDKFFKKESRPHVGSFAT